MSEVMESSGGGGEATKRRRLRQKLLLAKMQMQLLNARIGLADTKAVAVLGTSEDITKSQSLVADVDAAIDSSLSPKDSHSGHGRELSESIQGLESLAADLAAATEQIEIQLSGARQMSSKRKSMVDYSAQSESNAFLMKERDDLRKQVRDLEAAEQQSKEKIKMLEMQLNSAKKTVPSAAKKGADAAQAPPKGAAMKSAAAAVASAMAKSKQSIVSSAGSIDWAKYRNFEKMGMDVADKMKKDGLSDADIAKFMRKDPVTCPGSQPAGADAAAKYAKYEKMKKMKMPESAIVGRMKMDGLTADEIEQWLHPSPENDPRFDKYRKMQKMKMPESAIEGRMKMDGLSKEDIDSFLHPKKEAAGSAKGVTLEDMKKDPAYAKFFKMKSMGLPPHVITNKMKLDGIDKLLIDVFEGKIPSTAAAGGSSLTLDGMRADEKYAKYFRMKDKMRMPIHVVVNKMKLDGIPKDVIAVFEGKPPKKAEAEEVDRVAEEAKKLGMKPKPKVKPNKAMKRFHWKTVPMKDVKKSEFWSSIDDSQVKFDISAFEEAFAVPEKPKKGLLGKVFGKKEGGEEKKADCEIKFVDAKRQYACELLLKRLKLDGDQLRRDILSMNDKALNTELLQKVIDLSPTEEERSMTLDKLKEHHYGDKKKDKTHLFGVVESFFVKLSPIVRIRDRLEIWHRKQLFTEQVTDKQERILVLQHGLEAIRTSESLKEFFAIVLAFGNYLNGGKKNGQAYAFKLETLRMISGMKTADGKFSLLMYICKHNQPPPPTPLKLLSPEEREKVKKAAPPAPADDRPPLAVRLSKELECVAAAASTDIVILEKQISELQEWVDSLPNEVGFFGTSVTRKKSPGGKVNDSDVFSSRLNSFYNSAAAVMTSLNEQLQSSYSFGSSLCSDLCYEAADAPDSEASDNKAANTAGLLKIMAEFLKDFRKEAGKYTQFVQKKVKQDKKALQDFEKKERLKQHIRRMTAVNAMFANEIAHHSSDEEESSEGEESDEDGLKTPQLESPKPSQSPSKSAHLSVTPPKPSEAETEAPRKKSIFSRLKWSKQSSAEEKGSKATHETVASLEVPDSEGEELKRSATDPRGMTDEDDSAIPFDGGSVARSKTDRSGKGKKKGKKRKGESKSGKGHVRRETRIRMAYGTLGGAANTSFNDIHARQYYRRMPSASDTPKSASKAPSLRSSPLGSSAKTVRVIQKQQTQRKRDAAKAAKSTEDPAIAVKRYKSLKKSHSPRIESPKADAASEDVFEF